MTLFLLPKFNVNIYGIMLSTIMLISCNQSTEDNEDIVATAITTVAIHYDESASCPSIFDNKVNKQSPANKLQININFQPNNTDIPRDYLADTGLQFDNRNNGYSYGWSKNVSKGARDRSSNNSKDQRYDTLLHMLHPSLDIKDYWEINLPNNNYQIKLVAGDPGYCDKLYEISVEDRIVINKAPGCSHFVESTINVAVTDGYLTIKALKGSIDAKLAFIEITEINTLPDTTPPSTVYNEKITVMNEQLLVEWQNPLYDFVGTLLIYDTKPINFSPTQNIDCSDYKNMKGASFIVQDNNRALLSLLENEKTYYIKIFSFDESFNYAKPINLTATPHPITAQKEKEISETLMETLQANNSPEVIYETFKNFSKTHFGALFTPQIYNKYGNDLKIIDESKWQYISKYSAVLAWGTNLPAKTIIEYHKQGGEKKSSMISERFFYTHLHYLNDLEPNTSYVYKITSTDERKNTIKSVGTFTTGINGKVIEIPGTLGPPPYILTESNVTYLLTEDITAPSGAIQIKSDQIILDLGGHIITFANKHHKSYQMIDINKNGIGIYRSGYRNEDAEIKIYNGTLMQSNINNKPDSTIGVLNPVYIKNQKEIEIAGLTIDYHTPQTYGVTLTSASGTVNIHHNVFKDRGSIITNRHGGGGARPISFQNSEPGINSFEIHHNLIKRTRQNGLMHAHKMYNNEIYVDSWSTNSFGIQPNGEKDINSGIISDNKIFLTGYHAIGIAWGRKNLLVNNNFIHMEGINTAKNRWYESFGDQNSLNGLRLTNYGAGGQIRNNLHYSGNLIVGNARHGSMIRGTELFGDYSIKNTIVNDSIIEINSEDNKTTRVSAVVTQGTSSKKSNPTYYKNTTLRSNIANVRFGDNYGKGYNHHFYNVTFDKQGDNSNYHTFIFDGGYSRDGHIIRDPIFKNGAKYDDVYWQRTGNLSAYSIEWTLTIEAEKAEPIEIYDVNNTLVFKGAVNNNGKISIPLKEVTIRPKEWSNNSKGSGVRKKSEHQKIMHTPHRIVLVNQRSNDKIINMNETRTVNYENN